MTRAWIKLKNGEIINIAADSYDRRDEWISVYKGDLIVAMVRVEETAFCYISEQKN